MILKTELFKLGLKLLSSVQGNKIYPGLSAIYTKGGKIFGEIISDEGFVLQVKLSDSTTEDLDFGIIIFKLENILRNCELEDFELSKRANTLITKTEMEAVVSLYGGADSVPKAPGYKDAVIKTAEWDLKKWDDMMVEYIKNTHKGDKTYSYVYVKDILMSVDGTCVRRSKAGLDFPYPIFINKNLYGLITSLLPSKEDTVINISFYSNRYEFSKGDNKVIVVKNSDTETAYKKNVLTLSYTTEESPTFTITKSLISQVIGNLPFYIKESRNVVFFKIIENKVTINSKEDRIEIPFDFKKEGGFSYKKINIAKLSRISNYFKDEIKVTSGTQILDYLYMENDREYIVLTVVE